jgi:GGDEF domain-containing protein
MTKRRIPPARLTGALLLVASIVLGASTIPGSPAAVETIGFALMGTVAAAFADLRLRTRRLGSVVVLALLVAIGDRLASVAVPAGQAWALPIAFGAYLVWLAETSTPNAVLRGVAPALVAVSLPLAVQSGGTDPLVMSLAVLPIALAAAAIAVPRARGVEGRSQLEHNQRDLDAVVMANVELRNVAEARDAGHRIARIAAELLEAEGAVVWLQGPGRMLCAGGHGVTPSTDREFPEDSTVDQALRTGSLSSAADELSIPLTASGGAFGCVTVSHPGRSAASFVASLLQVFGSQAGYALERLRAVESLIDARYVDPVTGVGNRLAATASLATLHDGDAVLLLAVDELPTIRAIEGDARADLVLGQLGLHLRTATRAGDLVARYGDDVFFVMLRELSSSAESDVTRLIASWQETGAAGRLRAGAALHFDGQNPLETFDRASEALDAACLDLRDPMAIAAERAAWGPAA